MARLFKYRSSGGLMDFSPGNFIIVLSVETRRINPLIMSPIEDHKAYPDEKRTKRMLMRYR